MKLPAPPSLGTARPEWLEAFGSDVDLEPFLQEDEAFCRWKAQRDAFDLQLGDAERRWDQVLDHEIGTLIAQIKDLEALIGPGFSEADQAWAKAEIPTLRSRIADLQRRRVRRP